MLCEINLGDQHCPHGYPMSLDTFWKIFIFHFKADQVLHHELLFTLIVHRASKPTKQPVWELYIYLFFNDHKITESRHYLSRNILTQRFVYLFSNICGRQTQSWWLYGVLDERLGIVLEAQARRLALLMCIHMSWAKLDASVYFSCPSLSITGLLLCYNVKALHENHQCTTSGFTVMAIKHRNKSDR